MKQSGFKKPSYKEALKKQREKQKKAIQRKPRKAAKKRSRSKKQPSMRLLKKKLWAECKRITRERYVLPNGGWNCFTCGRYIDTPVKAHTAHFIPSSTCGLYLRYDLRNLRVCCYYCNINLGGNGAIYYKKLVEENGQNYVDEIFEDKNKEIKGDTKFYEEKIKEYRNLETS